MVVSILKAKSEACPPGTAASQQGPRIAGIPAAVLAKEAVYNAAGVGAYGVHDYIDFKQWLQSTLLQVCILVEFGFTLRPARAGTCMCFLTHCANLFVEVPGRAFRQSGVDSPDRVGIEPAVCVETCGMPSKV